MKGDFDMRMFDSNVNQVNNELAIPKMPIQQWTGKIYRLDVALEQGTIFPELNMEFYMGGVRDEL